MKKPASKSQSAKNAALKSAARSSRDAPVRQRARRLPAAERKALILQEAALFFSENGFAASTRDLADRLGVRQALLYKYFSSKEALIEAVFDAAFADAWFAKWAEILSQKDVSLEARLRAFYSNYADDPEDPDHLRLRLYLRGALDGWPVTARIEPRQSRKFVLPLVAEMRQEEGLPDFTARKLMKGERELVLSLHGAVIFHCIRAHVYKSAVAADHEAVAGLYIDVFLRGARAGLRAMHEGKAPAGLTAAAGG